MGWGSGGDWAFREAQANILDGLVQEGGGVGQGCFSVAVVHFHSSLIWESFTRLPLPTPPPPGTANSKSLFFWYTGTFFSCCDIETLQTVTCFFLLLLLLLLLLLFFRLERTGQSITTKRCLLIGCCITGMVTSAVGSSHVLCLKKPESSTKRKIVGR